MSASIFQLAIITILLSSPWANAQSSQSSQLSSSTSLSSLPPAPSVSFVSVNPTAVPLSRIGATEPASPTPTLASTPTSGSVPTFLPNAPPLPPLSSIVASKYPKLDTIPPIDSPEVQQWIAEVQASGIQIPSFSPTVAGGCPTNPQAATDPSRCWWTCGGCVRDTDISSCPTKDTWGLTYDDGPAYYTPNLLNYLDEHSLKSTFFVIGSRAASLPALLQSEYMAEHHISVHTWSHAAPLTTLSNEQIIAELGWCKKIIKDVLGVTPNTMRPPYGDIDDRVRAISLAMGLRPIMWTRISPAATFDTGDFSIHAGTISAAQVLLNWQYILGNASTLNTGFIVLEHDLFQQSVEIATGYILPDALARTSPKLTLQPVITCLNQPLGNAYIETNDNTTNPPPVTIRPSSKCSNLSHATFTTKTYAGVGTGHSSGRPTATGATGNNGNTTGGNQSGGASSLQSLPDMVIFVLLSLIAGLAVVF
ncbi:hypothetical protein BDM02DRAFT_3216331 [Thelephora ganbajun]|uniref:Uncharacterized protein n=1 Tax=Thelephora ganbajun TaxID=370292 RepID=A0ACB6ZVS7_THEGA|nr:hypothetical protein BDM02DRAFT_3216331 [Thelephora ganbajun]